MVKEVYNPKAVIPHAASLHQACAHCAIFPTAASRRSLGRISVPVWPDTLSGRLPVVALVGHHPTNKLIGRGPIPHRKSFPPPGHATSRVYSVLDPVSQAYPKVQGRSPTCYSPVRHSSTPERAFPFDLHVLSTPPAFVLSQDQTLQTKTSRTPKGTREFESEKPDHSKKTPKTGIKKTKPHPHTGSESMAKNNNKTKPPNTLLSSQTTPVFGQPCYCTPSQKRRQTAPSAGFSRRAPYLPSYSTLSISAPRLARFSTNSG